MYYTLNDRLENLTVVNLLKIYNSNKEFIFFDINVFNVGVVTRIILTNDYDKYSNYIVNNWNGYDTILENNSELFYTVEEILCSRFLAGDTLGELSKFKLNQLKKIYKNNNNKY